MLTAPETGDDAKAIFFTNIEVQAAMRCLYEIMKAGPGDKIPLDTPAPGDPQAS
jgi:hypothetical protein